MSVEDQVEPQEAAPVVPGRHASVQAHASSFPAPFSRPGELDLFALVLLLRAHLLRTILIALVCLIGTVIYTYRVTPLFSSTASIIIPARQPTSAASALEALGGLDLLGGGYDVFVDILRSHTVQDALIRKFNLMQHYGVDQMWMAERALNEASTIVVAREGLLTITVTDPDRNLAAQLANAYAVELEQLNGHLAITSASQQRAYYEQQLTREKDALAEAEAQYAAVQQKTSLISPDVQASQNLGALAGAQANLRQLTVELQTLEQGATDLNPEVIRLKSQISAVSGQIARMEAGSGGNASGTSISALPSQTLQVARAGREVKFHEALFDALSKAYEGAKSQEGRDIAVLQVLDPATPGPIKIWPPRVKYWTYGLVLGFLLGLVLTLLEALIRATLRNETNRARLRAFVLAPRG